MRIVSLTVEGFGCIEKAGIELNQGLNILHGPNDLGKSTLVEAARAALLLMTGQKEHERFIPWYDDVQPEVKLVIELEDGFYRIFKRFGSGANGKSTLEESKDGANWTMPTKGREVDGRLRELLRWGLPGPGGKGGKKGMPEPFLSVVLLPQQDRVAEVLGSTLDEDPDESGKTRLIEALQALSVDPLFKSVLDQTQSKVDEAFTAKGKRKGGKTSPWTDAKDRVNAADEKVRELAEKAARAKTQAEQVLQLQEEVDAKRKAVIKAKARVEELNHAAAQHKERQQVEALLERAKKELKEIDEIFAEWEASKKAVEELKAQASIKHQAHETAVELETKATAALIEAEEAKARLESEEHDRERQLAISKLEKSRAELEKEISKLTADKDRAAEAMKAIKELETAKAERQVVQDELEAESNKYAEAQKTADGLSQDVSLNKHLLALGKLKHAQRQLEMRNEITQKAAEMRKEAEEAQEQAIEIDASLEGAPSLEPTELEKLRLLEKDLEVAKAKLEVGVSLAIEPQRPLVITVKRDENSVDEVKLDARAEFDAQKSISLAIDTVGTVTAVAGQPKHRAEYQMLCDRWKSEAVGVLDAALVADVTGLSKAIDEAATKRREATSLREQAQRLRTEAEAKLKNAPAIEQLEADIAQRQKGLQSVDQDALEKAFVNVDEAQLETRIEKLAKKLDEAKAAAHEHELTVHTKKATLEANSVQITQKQDAVDQLCAVFEGGPEAVVSKADAQLQELTDEHSNLEAKIKQLENEAVTQVKAVNQKVASCKQAIEDAKIETTKAKMALDETTSNLATEEGRFGVQQKRVKTIDREAKTAEVNGLQEQLAEFSGEPVTDADVEAAQQNHQQAQTELDDAQQKLHNAQGAMDSLGGQVVEEQKHEWEEVLRLAEAKQQQLGIEYDAWRLLLDTLNAVEKEEAGHVGRALVNPVAKQMKALTKGRYDALEIGPDLKTTGVVVAGAPREIGQLSIGTKEQFATILRMSLALQLKSCVILDDQLTQSDLARFEWVRDMLYEAARDIQVIVMTCHPKSYVVPGRESEFHAVDLARVIRRYEK